MAGYIGKSQGVTQVDGYNRSEADAEFVQVSGDTMSANGATVLTVDRVTSDGAIIDLQKDGTSAGTLGSLNSARDLHVNSTGGILTLESNFNSTERQVVFGDTYLGPRAADNGAVDLGRSVAKYKDLYLSGGVYLGGTGSANYLDDYEEGTWTPTYVPATTSFTSITYDGATFGKYTKIGQSVYILGVIRTDSISGGAGTVDLGGIPFSPLYGDVSINIGYTTAFAGDHPSGGYLSSSGLINLTYKTSVSGPLNNFLNVSDLGTTSNDNFILFTMTYITSA